MRYVYETKVFKGPNLIVTNQFCVKTFQNFEILWKRFVWNFSFAVCLQEWFENWTFENCSPLARKYKTDKENPLTKDKSLAISFLL